MSRWTPEQFKEYAQRRLKQEERARKEIYANHNHTKGLQATEPQPDCGQALVGSSSREAPRSTGSAQRAKITYIVRAKRPCDFDNWNIKFLQDCLIAAGILDDDNWQVLSGQVVSDKAFRGERESTVIIIEKL